MSRRNRNRFFSIVVTLALVIVTNIAISYGASAFMAAIMDSPPAIPSASLEDARAALRLVRSRVADWKIDPARVGLLGFSGPAPCSGLDLALGEDNTARPDFFASIYGPLGARPVPADESPIFAVLAADDPFFASAGFRPDWALL